MTDTAFLSPDDVRHLDNFEPKTPVRIRLPELRQGAADPQLAAADKPGQGSSQSGSMPVVDPVNTHGYDTVFALRIDRLNKAMAKAMKDGKIPSTFAIEHKGVLKFTFAGDFGGWRITNDGSGMLLNMALPVAKGLLQSVGSDPYDVSGCEIVVQVSLRLNDAPPSDQPKDPQQGTVQELRLALNDPTKPPVSYLRMDKFAPKPTKPGQPELSPEDITDWMGILGESLRAWVVEHAEEVDFIFAKVQLGNKLVAEGWDWMTPTSSTYAYSRPVSGGNGFLALLNMTGGRDGSKLAQEVSANALPDDADGAFLLSRDLLMQKLMMPAMQQIFTGATTEDFVYDPKLQTIKAKRPLTAKEFTASDGKKYSPKVESFTVSFISGGIQIDCKSSVDVSFGVTGWAITKGVYQMQMDPKTQKMTLVKQFDSEDHWCDVSPGAIAIGVAVGIFATMVGAWLGMLGGLGLLAAFALAALIVGGLTGLAFGIIAAVGKGQAADLASADLMINQAMAPIEWKGVKALVGQKAEILECLRVAGDPVFLDD